MAELIDKGAFIEDIKTEIVNLSMDGLKGTPRDRSDLYGMIDRINEQPTTTEAEIRAIAKRELASEIMEFVKSNNRGSADYFIVDKIEELCMEQLKGE